MPSERVTRLLHDIMEAIHLIREWVKDAGGVDQALHHTLVRSAIERQLLVVSEASSRIDRDPSFASAQAPEISWSGMRRIGNGLQHRYDDPNTQAIVGVLNNRLAPLEATCRRLLSD